ncbi:hypothetical protein CALCODRAFT_308945 [Calocera cornea HHB12733]|uniref:Uncharacterized protein n=1 Tax=Calocera cornea HHB12733 TaxID=1353952 RepID=A0A165FH23_9BASI|nr:hypothetical protein CALCODRAFT_308945 [Calocera cornea HHB12733]
MSRSLAWPGRPPTPMGHDLLLTPLPSSPARRSRSSPRHAALPRSSRDGRALSPRPGGRAMCTGVPRPRPTAVSARAPRSCKAGRDGRETSDPLIETDGHGERAPSVLARLSIAGAVLQPVTSAVAAYPSPGKPPWAATPNPALSVRIHPICPVVR